MLWSGALQGAKKELVKFALLIEACGKAQFAKCRCMFLIRLNVSSLKEGPKYSSVPSSK